MALQATPYKVELNLTDLDRGVYENLRFTVARHPSETEERLGIRLIAYALWYSEQLADGRVLHWIEVGQPDAERLTWCSRRAERMSLVAYGNLRVWQSKVVDAVKGLKNLSIAAIESESLADLVKDLPRSIQWGVMISDGTLFITDERGQFEVSLSWLMGER